MFSKNHSVKSRNAVLLLAYYVGGEYGWQWVNSGTTVLVCAHVFVCVGGERETKNGVYLLHLFFEDADMGVHGFLQGSAELVDIQFIHPPVCPAQHPVW